MTTLYAYRFDRDAEGAFYVKQRAEGGEMLALPDAVQDRRRFATWQEAKAPADKWAADANDPRAYRVCNPQYQQRRIDGVMAHLEMDPRTGGTILVRDRDCRDRALARDLVPPCPVSSGVDGAPCQLLEGHTGYHEVTPMRHYTADELRALPTLSQGHTDDLKVHEGDSKVWLSRMTVEDGMPYNDQITVERLVDGRWITVEEYAG